MGKLIPMPATFAERLSHYHAARALALSPDATPASLTAWSLATDAVIAARAVSPRALAAKVRIMAAERRFDAERLSEILADLLLIDAPSWTREAAGLNPLARVMYEQNADPDMIEAMGLRYLEAADQIRAAAGKAVAHA